MRKIYGRFKLGQKKKKRGLRKALEKEREKGRKRNGNGRK